MYSTASTIPIIFDDQDMEGVYDAQWCYGHCSKYRPCQRLMCIGRLWHIYKLSFSIYLTLGWEITQLNKCPTPLVRFVGKIMVAKGCIDLPIIISEGETQVMKVVEFVFIDQALDL